MSDTGFRLLFHSPHRAQRIFNVTASVLIAGGLLGCANGVGGYRSVASAVALHASVVFVVLSVLAYVIGKFQGAKIFHAGLNLIAYGTIVLMNGEA